MNVATHPRLLADIGGTNARFAWQVTAGAALTQVMVTPCADHATLEAAMRHYLTRQALTAPPACAIGIATAVTG